MDDDICYVTVAYDCTYLKAKIKKNKYAANTVNKTIHYTYKPQNTLQRILNRNLKTTS